VRFLPLNFEKVDIDRMEIDFDLFFVPNIDYIHVRFGQERNKSGQKKKSRSL